MGEPDSPSTTPPPPTPNKTPRPQKNKTPGTTNLNPPPTTPPQPTQPFATRRTYVSGGKVGYAPLSAPVVARHVGAGARVVHVHWVEGGGVTHQAHRINDKLVVNGG